jgi:hypothetical protein
MIQNNSDVGADSNWGTTFRRGLENWGEGARVSTVLDSGGGKFSKRQKKKPNKTKKKKEKTFIQILITVPEMDGRQMRLISYSGDQKLLQIR